MHTIEVTLPTQSYDVRIEPGLLEHLGGIVAAVCPHERALLAVDSNIGDSHGAVARRSLEAADFAVLVHEIVADERHKTLETVHRMYQAMLARRLERGSPVIALGGGLVGDVAGFAAATYLRGVPLVHAPTTLLAMVDASIGGKTGVNFPLPRPSGGGPQTGKNLVGAFWQPHAVVVDPLLLRTLDPRHLRCGLAECVKHAIIADPGLFAFIESNVDQIAALEPSVVTELIVRGASVKVGIVREDEREAGMRALLNLGHTFAHVIEPIETLDLHHGEAVAIGLCAAADCAVQTGRLARPDADRIRGLLRRAGLPDRLPHPMPAAPLVEAMGFDKKVIAGRARLVLPTAIGRADIAGDVPRPVIAAAWWSVGALNGPDGSDAAEGPGGRT